MAEYLSKHPRSVMLFVGILGAYVAVGIYRIGVTHNQLQGSWQIATSEALGG